MQRVLCAGRKRGARAANEKERNGEILRKLFSDCFFEPVCYNAIKLYTGGFYETESDSR
jgi:hypothetical protein